MKLVAVCHTCARKHAIDFDPSVGPGAAFGDWLQKHPGGVHDVDFVWPERSGKVVQPAGGWLHYAHNADVKVAYGSSFAYTITLGALGSSSDFTAGRESTAVSNTTNLYLDYLVGGKVKTGTSPTTLKNIRVYAYGSVNDTPTYPDVLDGTDSAETITDTEILAKLPLLDDMPTDDSSDQDYWFGPRSLASCFGGLVPKNHGLFVSHDTAVNLNATDGNHVINGTGTYATVA